MSHKSLKFDYFPLKKLHELKTWFSSNHYIALVFYEHFYSGLPLEDRKKFNEGVIQINNEKDRAKRKVELAKKSLCLPILYNTDHQEHHNQIIEFVRHLFENCTTNFADDG